MAEITVYFMKGCGPCKMLKQALKREEFDYKVVNIDEDTKAAMEANIKAAPTTIVTDENGVELVRVVGMGTEVISRIKEVINPDTSNMVLVSGWVAEDGR